MLRSLYSGISGLKVNQEKMDVIGNNIANVGTTAFKGSRTRFESMLSQNITDAAGASTNMGGVNSSQIGLGAQVSGIDTILTQGTVNPTGVKTDFLIDGDGYFMVAKGAVNFAKDTDANAISVDLTDDTNPVIKNGALANAGVEVNYTRDGSFSKDNQGNLLYNGYRVLGYTINTAQDDPASTTTPKAKLQSLNTNGVAQFADGSTNVTADNTTLRTLRIPDTVTDGTNTLKVKDFSVDKNGVINLTLDDGRVSAVGQIAMANFVNPGGLDSVGGNLYQSTTNSGAAVLRSAAGAATDNSKAYGDVVQNALEMSNVDLAQQFTDMIVAQRAFEASGKMISNGDEILQDIINLKR